MKFCDEKIQKHLLNGGKVSRNTHIYPVYLDNNGLFFDDKINGVEARSYNLDRQDLIADDWEILEPKYDWDKIIKDKILCVFSDEKDYSFYVISPLIRIDDYGYSFQTIGELSYAYCKPFNPAEFNIAKNLKEYEK